MPHALLRAALGGVLAVAVTGCAAPSTLRFAPNQPTPATMPVPEPTPTVTVATTVDQITSTSADEPSPRHVEQAFTGLLTEWIDCFHRPARCEVNQLTAANSPERERLTQAVAYYADEKIRTKPDEGRLEWGTESISMTSQHRARLLVCEYDSRMFFDSSMADTEFGDIIFDTTVWTRRVEWTIDRADGAWKLWSRRVERRSPIARFCTP